MYWSGVRVVVWCKRIVDIPPPFAEQTCSIDRERWRPQRWGSVPAIAPARILVGTRVTCLRTRDCYYPSPRSVWKSPTATGASERHQPRGAAKARWLADDQNLLPAASLRSALDES